MSFNHNVFNEEFTVSGSFVDTQTSSDQTMNSKLMTNNTSVTNSKQFTPKSYVDALVTPKVSKSGDSLTGHLSTNQTSFSANQLVTKQYVDTQDGLLVAKAGSSLTGHLTSNQTSFTANDQLVTKKFVDDNSFSVAGSAGDYKVPLYLSGSTNPTGSGVTYTDIPRISNTGGDGQSIIAWDGGAYEGGMVNASRGNDSSKYGSNYQSYKGRYMLKKVEGIAPVSVTTQAQTNNESQKLEVKMSGTSSDDGQYLKWNNNSGVAIWSAITASTNSLPAISNSQSNEILRVNAQGSDFETFALVLQDGASVSNQTSLKATSHNKSTHTIKTLKAGTNVTFSTPDDPNCIEISSSGGGGSGAGVTIDDLSTSTTKVWSSDKTSQQILAKAPLSHTHAISDIVNLTTSLQAKMDDTQIKTAQTSSSTTDVYSTSYINALSLFDGNYNSLSNKPSLFSGSYVDLSNKPSLFSGSYVDLSNKPAFHAVSTSGSYNDLINRPTLFNGDYASLSNKPTLFSGSYVDLSNKPALHAVSTSGSYNDLINRPTLFNGDYTSLSNKPSLFSGSYVDLSNKPTLFSGSYADLSNKPTLLSLTPTTNRTTNYVLKYNGTDVAWGADATASGGSADGVLSNLAISSTGLLTATLSNGNSVTEQIDTDKLGWKVYPQTSDLPNASNHHGMLAHVHTGGVVYFAHNGNWVKLANYSDLVQADWNATGTGLSVIANKPTLFDGNYNSLSNKPSLGAVATSNSYNDLSNLPTIPSAQVRSDWNATGTGISVIENKPSLFDGNYNSLSNKPTITPFPSFTTVSNAGQIFFIGDSDSVQIGSKDAYTFATDRSRAQLTTTRYYTQSSSPYTYSNQQTTVNLLPTLSSGKYLFNDGSNLSWAVPTGSTDTYVSAGQVNSSSQLVLTKSDASTVTISGIQPELHSGTISTSGILSLNHIINGTVSTVLTVQGIQPKLSTVPNILTATNNSPATGDVYASSVINAYQSLQNTRHTGTETKTRYMNSPLTNLTSFTNQVNMDHTLQVVQNAGTTESQLRLIRNSTATNNLGLGNLSFGTSTSGGTMDQHYAYIIGKIGQNSTSYGTMKFFCLQNNADVELLEVGQNYVSDPHIKMHGTVKIDHRLLVSTTNGGEVFIGSDYTPAPNVGLGSITYGSDIANSYAYIQAKITSVTPKYGQMMFSTKINDAKTDIMTLGQTTSTDPYVTMHGQLQTSSAGIKFSDGTTLTTAPASLSFTPNFPSTLKRGTDRRSMLSWAQSASDNYLTNASAGNTSNMGQFDGKAIDRTGGGTADWKGELAWRFSGDNAYAINEITIATQIRSTNTGSASQGSLYEDMDGYSYRGVVVEIYGSNDNVTSRNQGGVTWVRLNTGAGTWMEECCNHCSTFRVGSNPVPEYWSFPLYSNVNNYKAYKISLAPTSGTTLPGSLDAFNDVQFNYLKRYELDYV